MTDTTIAATPLIDFLYSEDCPSHERALAMLHEVLDAEGVEAEVRIHQVETEEEAEDLRFPGSPTIRVNGADIEDTPPDMVGLSCRAYIQENGRISPLPPRAKIEAAIRAARPDESEKS